MFEKFIFGDMTYKEFGLILGGLITLFTFILTYFEFRKNNRAKRSEFLEKLTQEFNEPKMYLAKKILDDFWIERNGSPELSDEELVRQGSEQAIEKSELTNRITHLLRNHRDQSVTGFGEQKARQSFDDLLDFFTKLEYYIDLGLIKEKELNYFKYYLEKCAYKAAGAVLSYARTYEYSSVLKLIASLGINTAERNN